MGGRRRTLGRKKGEEGKKKGGLDGGREREI